MGNNSAHAVSLTGDETCVICQENVNGKISRPNTCKNHFFHHTCLVEWSKHKNTCPLDNTEFTAIIDCRGKKIAAVEKPEEGDGDSISALFERMLMISHILRLAQHCFLCNEEHPDWEKASSDACGHRFHRKCLTSLSRINNICPVDDCGQEFSELHCEYGDVLTVSDLKESSLCQLCGKVFNGSETATPNNCKHRFHRQCLHIKTKDTKKCPICESDVLFLKSENGERVVIQRSFELFECSLCKSSDLEKEPLRISPCGHRFHRECFLSLFRNMTVCPIESCSENIDIVHCQYGDSFQVRRNGINNLIATVTCSSDFRCIICSKQNPDIERAKLDCDCEFHRQCIVSRLRREPRDNRCPRCGEESSTIHCLHGDRIELSGVNTSSTDSSSSNGDVEASATSDLAEGATGGTSEEIKCNLCESKISKSDSCRPKECMHWFHKDCMRNMCEEFDCCISCQSEIEEILDESGQNIKSELVKAPVTILPTSNTDLRCFTCGDIVTRGYAVHPDGCICLFHRSCLTSIKEIMSFCPICNVPFETIENF